MRRHRHRWLLVGTTLVVGCRSTVAPPSFTPATLQYDEGASTQRLAYLWSAPEDPYLVQMRARHPLAQVAGTAASDLARVRAVSRWVHTQFRHDGNRASRFHDPMGILDEAATGARFRCVEYAAVTSGALSALGIPSRKVWLLTRDEATRTDGIAHVVAEAYLRDVGRWVLVDAQWDAVPTRDGLPLSAIELQRSLVARETGIAVSSASGTSTSSYLAWVAPYLHYFYTPLDARIGVTQRPGAVLLTPVGDRSLTGKYPTPTTAHTHSVADFYPVPD